MNEMIGYIFGSLDKSEKAIGVIAKALKKQSTHNKWVTAFAILVAAESYITTKLLKQHQEQIEALSRELEELKNEKGE